MRLYNCLLLAPLLAAVSSFSADFHIMPETITLRHQNDYQQLLTVEMDEGRAVDDLTRDVTYIVADPGVARVDEHGVAHPVAPGETRIEARVGDRTVSARVVVESLDPDRLWSFANDVQPALTKIGCNAGACHGAAAGKNGFKLSLRGYDHQHDYNVLTRQAKGRRVLIAEPDASLMLQKPSGGVPHGGGRLLRRDSLEYKIIREWIAQQAPAPSENDPELTAIEVFPKAIRRNVDAQQQLIVTASFSDGVSKDVTRWCKFGTTNDGVAVIADDGLATIKRPGGAALTVWYAGKVTFASVEVPFESEVSDAVFAQAERFNYIDDKVLDRLKALRIAPSKLCTDAEFVRRAYLDSTGVLPSERQAVAFLMDGAPDKRARLIDSLLGGDEYVDYWSYHWSDLMLASSTNPSLGSREALLAYYRFIRESVKANIGWDEFTRRVLTAQGSTLENGAANYFVLHKETTDLVETTSKAFMGLSITCARCHNHPMEKWTQDDYYGMANLLARVRLKNGDRSGETFVYSGDSGDILHPVYGKPMKPKPLDARPMPMNAPDRRAYLAEWLTSKENPYFARAIINRVWKNYMGVGLVEEVDDLRQTNPPTNEALFAALEEEFVANGYDVKQLMRDIMNSAAYQRSSEPRLGNESDQRNYSRYFPRRLPAEVILDGYSEVTRAPTKFSGYPDGWRALQLPDTNVASSFLTVFGRPERKMTCSCERNAEPTLSQALNISNGDTLNEKLRRDGNVIDRFLDSGDSLEQYVFDLYMAALTRTPSQEEEKGVLDACNGEEGWSALDRDERRRRLEDVTWAVLSGKEFLFNH
ncbi:MAG: DUF1553 domain-containing protein [bacterium]|nr:DUF1553 domain-containing protein [bacterium]